MTRNVLYLIRTGMDGFSKGQKRIAKYILSDYDKAAFMTACRLGQIAEVSESTVVRFAAQLGYDGYPAMQKALQELIRGKLTSIQRIEASGEQMSGGDIAGSVMQRDMETIRSTIERMDRAEFDLAVEKLVEAKHIYLLGVRSSSFLAGYLNFYFHLIFKNVTLVQSSAAGEIFDQMLHIGPGDVLVGISFPRYSMRTLKAMEFANNRNAGVIAITDSIHSPMNLYSSCNLFSKCSMAKLVDSLVAPMSLINSLIIALCIENSQKTVKRMEELEMVWNDYQVAANDEINYLDEELISDLKGLV